MIPYEIQPAYFEMILSHEWQEDCCDNYYEECCQNDIQDQQENNCCHKCFGQGCNYCLMLEY